MSHQRSTLRPLIFGARSAIGEALLGDLPAGVARAFSRCPLPISQAIPDARWSYANLPDAPALTGDVTHLISLGPGDVFLSWLMRQSPQPALRQIILLGSTSADTKIDSAAASERALAEKLRHAQSGIQRESERLDVPWTILRPTLIYGGSADSVARLGRWIRHRRVYPWLLGAGAHTQRQPVHAHDLARAVSACLDCEPAFNRVFDLPGGETLGLRDFICRIAQASNAWAVPIPIALSMALRLLSRLKLLPASAAFDMDASTRLQRDQVFDASAAIDAFGYSARRFEPESSPW